VKCDFGNHIHIFVPNPILKEMDRNVSIDADAAYCDWWYNKTGETLAPRLVLLLQTALQGHPEAGESSEQNCFYLILTRFPKLYPRVQHLPWHH
jgi:hypothetical protein